MGRMERTSTENLVFPKLLFRMKASDSEHFYVYRHARRGVGGRMKASLGMEIAFPSERRSSVLALSARDGKRDSESESRLGHSRRSALI